MALKVELKPGERIIIGDCVITNDNQRTRFLVDGNAPILREKAIMTPERADTPAKRIYLAVQMMYLAHEPRNYHEFYFKLVREIMQAAPSTWPFIESINNQILTGNTYKALKEADKLIRYEGELLANAKCSSDLRKRSKTNFKSAQPGSGSAAAGRVAAPERA